MTLLLKFHRPKRLLGRVRYNLTVFFSDPYCVSSLLPRRGYVYPSVTPARPRHNPRLAYDTSQRLVHTCPPWARLSGIESLDHGRHRGVYFPSAKQSAFVPYRVDDKDRNEGGIRSRDYGGPIPRTGENWPASPRVATLIDIRRWNARMCRTGDDAAPRCGSGRRGAARRDTLKGRTDWSYKGVSEQLPPGEKVGRSAGKWQW